MFSGGLLLRFLVVLLKNRIFTEKLMFLNFWKRDKTLKTKLNHKKNNYGNKAILYRTR